MTPAAVAIMMSSVTPFDSLVEDASVLFEGAGVQVYSLDARSGELVPELGNAIAMADGPGPRPMGTGAAGRAAQYAAPVLIGDYGGSVGCATAAGRGGVRAAMGVPLFIEGHLVGAISVGVDHDRLHLGSDQLAALLALSQGWSKGDPLSLLAAIYEHFRRPSFGLAYRLLRDRPLAEEVVQDVFLSLWRSGAKHNPERGSLRTWVAAMVRHRAIDAHRARVRRPVWPLDGHAEEVQGGPDPTIDAQRRIDSELVQLALEDLSETQRQTIELAYFANLSHTEIAATLQAPVGTIKGRIRLALDHLRGSMLIQGLAATEPATAKTAVLSGAAGDTESRT